MQSDRAQDGLLQAAQMLLLAACAVGAMATATAQGINPGNPAKDAYLLPGGFEPVLQLRTYYFDQESLTGAPSAAWALGGWAGLRSPWWGDLFQAGIIGYTSQKLYGPEDKDGTKLLRPGQQQITVLGEAFGAVRILGQTITGYRQLVNRPFINPQDNRMVPNTFEAYTLTGSANDVSYTGGYITKMKARQSDSFVWMSNAAGGTGTQKGVAYAGGTWEFAKNGYVRMDEQYTIDVFNTFYIDGKYPIAIGDKATLTLGGQYYPQSSVGDAQTGAAIPDRNETDVRVDYAFGKGTILEGLVATFRYAWLHQEGSPTATELRAYLNYAVRF